MKVFYKSCDFSGLDTMTPAGARFVKLVTILDMMGYQPVDFPCEADIITRLSPAKDLWAFADKMIDEWPEDCSEESQLILVDEPDYSIEDIQLIRAQNPEAQICLLSASKIPSGKKKKNEMFMEEASVEHVVNLLRYADSFFSRTTPIEQFMGFGVEFRSEPGCTPYRKIKPRDFAVSVLI